MLLYESLKIKRVIVVATMVVDQTRHQQPSSLVISADV
nr:MAG TPA: hypothetical protein [Bacteriophage sp.]